MSEALSLSVEFEACSILWDLRARRYRGGRATGLSNTPCVPPPVSVGAEGIRRLHLTVNGQDFGPAKRPTPTAQNGNRASHNELPGIYGTRFEADTSHAGHGNGAWPRPLILQKEALLRASVWIDVTYETNATRCPSGRATTRLTLSATAYQQSRCPSKSSKPPTRQPRYKPSMR